MIHVWRARLTDFLPHATELSKVLSDGELQRARRYGSPAARSEFVVRRALLRLLLGAYTDQPPSSLALPTSPSGKPRLDGGAHSRPVRFSISSSGDVLLMVFSCDREVGVDVEAFRPANWAGLARWFLPAQEIKELEEMPAPERRERFFRLWSRMEACVKATGTGIRGNLDLEGEKLPWCAPESVGPTGLAVRDIRPAPECRGAIAAFGTDWHVRTFRVRRQILAAVGVQVRKPVKQVIRNYKKGFSHES